MDAESVGSYGVLPSRSGDFHGASSLLLVVGLSRGGVFAIYSVRLVIISTHHHEYAQYRPISQCQFQNVARMSVIKSLDRLQTKLFEEKYRIGWQLHNREDAETVADTNATAGVH